MASIAKRSDGQWRTRYRDTSGGKEHARHFARKVDAQRWLDETTTAIVSGAYVDPKAGRLTVREYGEQWRAAQVHRPSTQAHVETMLRRHIYPTLGDRPLSTVRPSEVQAWARGLTTTLQPATVKVVHGILAAIYKAAVRDRRVPASPCEGTKLPKATRTIVEPLSVEQVAALLGAVEPRCRAMLLLAAGTGMRQGECFGLTRDRVDFLRRSVVVDRQLVLVPGRPPFLAPPKTEASHRVVPLPNVVVDELAAHLATWPAEPEGLIFTTALGEPVRRTAFSSQVWRPAVKAAGLPVRIRFHDLRHHYASLLIWHGESVKVVQARLGHATAAETLDTYSHLWPDSDDRTREAVDAALGNFADSVRTDAKIN